MTKTKTSLDLAAAIQTLESIAAYLKEKRKEFRRSRGIDGIDYRVMTDEIQKAHDLISLLELEIDLKSGLPQKNQGEQGEIGTVESIFLATTLGV